ncbi:MAG TPA: type II toxin-antitoxin system Phd/YefM family antitoxin [Candidatus Xenobia bacterium]|jgi:prevent-host-death family protein
MKQINASEFKAKCLAILDEVEASGEPVTILKRGRPVAQLLPAPKISRPQDALRGTVTFYGDVIEPVLPPDAWEMDAGNV